MQHKIGHRDLENCNSLCQHRHFKAFQRDEIGVGIRRSAFSYASIGIFKHFKEEYWHRDSGNSISLCQYVNDTGHTSQQMKCISTHIRQENPTLQLHKPQFPSLTKNNQHSSRSELTFTTGCYSICITVRRFSYVRFH